MKKKPKNARLTKHDRAASDPKVKDRISKLKKRWKRANTEERSAMLLELPEDCSIRGLARDLDLPESTLRQYSKAPTSTQVAAAPKTNADSKQQVTAPLQKSVRSPEAPNYSEPNPSPSQAQASQSESKSVTANPPRPVSAISKARFRSVQLPPRPQLGAKEQPNSRPESLASLRDRAVQIIEDLIRSKYETPEAPADSAEITALFSSAETNIWLERQGFKSVALPDQCTVAELLAKTKPQTREETRSGFLGRWVAVILNSLGLKDGFARKMAIEEASRKLMPKPEKAVTTSPNIDRRQVWRPAEIRHTYRGGLGPKRY